MRLGIAYFLLFTIHPTFSQNEAAHWFFGYQAGLKFNYNQPIPIHNSAMLAQHGCAVISDKETSELLFYSNGRNVWNKEHQLMPNARDFPDSCWSYITQSALIVPYPGNESKFFLFSIFYTYTPGGSIFIEENCAYGRSANRLYRDLRYSIIDMKKHQGLGDIVEGQKNLLLHSNLTEKLTAIPHTNGKDYWVVVHEFEGNGFYAYPITKEGIGKAVISKIGSFHSLNRDQFFEDEETIGYMKSSPDGKKIACAVFGSRRPFDLFDFNASTGELSNYLNLGLIRGQYGVSFSPDNSKLYVSSDDRPDPVSNPFIETIVQFDLNAGDNFAIANSRRSLLQDNLNTNMPRDGTFNGFLLVKIGLQLGIDGKLYATSDSALEPSDGHIMVVIERPNELGIASDINYHRFEFGNGTVGIGLPNFIQAYFNGIESSTTCGDPENVKAFPNPTQGVLNIKFPDGCRLNTGLLTIYDSVGREIMKLQIEGVQSSVDISHLMPGTYFVLITTVHNSRIVKKIVKL